MFGAAYAWLLHRWHCEVPIGVASTSHPLAAFVLWTYAVTRAFAEQFDPSYLASGPCVVRVLLS